MVTLPWQYFRDPTKNYDCGHDWEVGCVACALLGAEEGFNLEVNESLRILAY